jgi:hypothetical protein
MKLLLNLATESLLRKLAPPTEFLPEILGKEALGESKPFSAIYLFL